MWASLASMMFGAAVPALPARPGIAEPSVERMAPGSTAPDDELAGLEVLSDEQLSTERGKFVWEGVQVELGAEIRTYLNGELVLQTNISWTAEGAQTTQVVSGALTPVDAAQLQAGILMTSGGIRMNVGDNNVFLANEGQTAIIHGTDGAVQNIILNTASNIQAVSEIDATLDLGNFGQFQQGVLDMRLGQAIGDIVAQAIITGN